MNIISAFNQSITSKTKVQNTSFAGFLTSEKSINNKNLRKDTFSRATNPVCPSPKEVKKITDENHKEVVKTLSLFSNNAQNSFEKQYKKDGIFAKTVDSISTIWFSNNRSTLVKKDIETYNQNIDKLEKSIDKGTFTTTFKDIFKVDYNQKNIDKFNEANERLMLGSTTQYMAETIKENLGKDLKIAEENKGELKDHIKHELNPYAVTGSYPYIERVTSKDVVFNDMEKAITKAVGGKDVLENMLEAKNIKKDATNEEKYTAYYNIAEFLTKTSQMTAEKCSNGKTLKELKEDYDTSYKTAFGDKNDIQKRVDEYNRSQKIGTSMLKTGVKNPVKLALLGFLGLTNPLATIPVSVALSYGFNMLEKATNENNEGGLSTKNLKELLKNTTQSYVDYAIEAGIDAVLPTFTTSNELLNTVISTARSATLNVTTNMVSDYMSTGKWDSSQVAPRALVTAVFGRISTDDELGKNLLSMTKGGVRDALLYDNSENNSVKQFIKTLQVELQKEYMKNPELYSSMKAISVHNPEAFEKMIVDLLQEQVDKASKSKKDN